MLQKKKLNNELIEEYAKSKRIKEELEKESINLKQDFDTFFESITGKKATLKADVDQLEKRRQEALKPINEELELLEKIKIVVDEEKKLVEETKEENQLVLDKNEKVLSNIKIQREKMRKQDVAIAEEIKELNVLSASVSKETDKLEADKTKFNTFLKEQTKILNDRDIKNKLLEEKIDNDKRIMKEEKIKMEKEQIKLTRRQNNLKIAFNEARLKNLL